MFYIHLDSRKSKNKRNGRESLFREIIVETFPILDKDLSL
jgi:hypothetical protein